MCRETRSEELVDDGGDHGDHDEVGKQLHGVDDQAGKGHALFDIAAGDADDAEDEAGDGQKADVGPAKDQAKQTADKARDAAAVRTALFGNGRCNIDGLGRLSLHGLNGGLRGSRDGSAAVRTECAAVVDHAFAVRALDHGHGNYLDSNRFRNDRAYPVHNNFTQSVGECQGGTWHRMVQKRPAAA